MNNELLPCPFCGAPAETESFPDSEDKMLYQVKCGAEDDNCAIQAWVTCDTEDEARDEWNRRSTPPATGAAAMREACASLVEGFCPSLHFVSETEWHAPDTMDAQEQMAAAIRALPALEVPDQMAAFGAAAWGLLKTRYGAAEMCEGDEAFIELALKAGLCTRQPYDREQHGYVEDADEGDMIYVWGNR